MKIDSHLHINLHNYTVNNLKKYLDDNKIDRCWLLSWEDLNPVIPSIYTPLPIDDIAEAFNRFPDRVTPFYAPDPKRADLALQFENFSHYGIRGCGELKVSHRWDSSEIENYLNLLSQYNMPLVFHMELNRDIYFAPNSILKDMKIEDLLNGALNGKTREIIKKVSCYIKPMKSHIDKYSIHFPGYMLDLLSLEEKMKEYPQIKFIGHGPHFWNSLSANINPFKAHCKGKIKIPGIIDLLLEKYDNLYCDISGKSGFWGLTRDREYAKYLLEKHYKKILYGTDNRRMGIEGFVKSFKLPEYKQKRIFGLNALELIKN